MSLHFTYFISYLLIIDKNLP